jgi:PAS domain S-box-containing protein
MASPLHRHEATATVTDCFSGGGEMGAVMRSMDWSKTLLGPVDLWSASLQMMVRLLLTNRFPLLLWWGPGYCQLYNDSYRPMLGTKHPKSMGEPARDCFPEIWHIIGPLIDSPFNGGPAIWMEDIQLEYQRGDFLEETHFTIAYSPVPDDSVAGGIGGVLATVYEITEKVLSERRVAALRDLAARSVDAGSAEEACTTAAEVLCNYPRDIPFALFYLIDDDQGSARLAALCGVDKESLAAPPVIDPRRQESDGAWPIGEVLTSGQAFQVEDLDLRLKTVPRGPWSDPPRCAALIPIRSNTAKKPAGVLVAGISPRLRFDDLYHGFFDLVSNQVAATIACARAYEEERKRAETLAEIDRAKTAFFKNVSREFRTPLNLTLGTTEDALRSPEGTLRGEDLKTVHRNQLRLLELVNSLLDFSRIQAGRLEAVYTPTDISSFTTDLASSFRPAMHRAGLRYEVDCEPIAEPLFIDRDRWERIVLNLISNALKFTFKGCVAVRVRAAGGSVKLEVSDTGTGIPQRELPHLFERFYRVEGAQGRTYEGTGIGLALVQELVELHRGTVSVQSVEGVGSTFTVTIPKGNIHLLQDRIGIQTSLTSSAIPANSYVEEALKWLPPKLAEDQNAWDDPDAALSTSGDPVPSQIPDDREVVVLADDNSDMRAYLRRLLGERFRVHAVSNGVDAVRAARDLNADLVLTDVMMPVLDGFGVLKALRSDPATRSIPVILLSARAGEESRVEGLQAGADDYLVKPLSAPELMARVTAHLKMARIRAENSEVERALRREVEEERDLLRDSFVESPAAMALLSGPDHRFTFVNAEYVRVSGRDDQQLIGRLVRDVFPEIIEQGFLEILDGVYRTGKQYVRNEYPLQLDRHGKRESIYLNFNYYPMRDPSGDVEGIMVHAVEITEQVLARNELEARVRERTAELVEAEEGLRELNQRLLQAQDEERRRLALELHDSAGQLVAALKFNLYLLKDALVQDDPEVKKRAAVSTDLIEELSRELRTVSHQLYPPALDNAGLSAALRIYLEGLAERGGLFVTLKIEDDLTGLPKDVETTIFRIIQESLTNVRRYAETRTAVVLIRRESENIRVEIRDDGRGILGFTSLDDQTFRTGVGIQGMRQRTRQLKGRFELVSGPGGTTVRVLLPL